MPSECSRSDESNHSVSHTSNYKETSENAARDKLSSVSTIPICIKFKKVTDEEATSKEQDNHGNDRFQHGLGKALIESPPIEIGPKRLKVRGPSFLGSDSSRLN